MMRPQTTKHGGSAQKKQFKFGLEDENELSIIKDSTNIETNHYDDSLNLDVLKNMIGGNSNFLQNINHGNLKKPLFSKFKK